MQLPIFVLIAWLTVSVFALIPKKLDTVDFLFLYFISFILTTSAFTLFDVNLHIVTISRTAAGSAATIVSRMITIPILIMAAVNALQPGGHRWSRGFAIICWLTLAGLDWLLNRYHVIQFHNWNTWHASISYLTFIAIAWFLMWCFTGFDERTVTPT